MHINEISGEALDWAVEVAEEMTVSQLEFQPSTNWDQGGPIIEREGIELIMPRLITRDKWCATRIEGSSVCEEYGPTPLIAAMRCYVKSRLGNEVDVPEELR